MANPRTRLALGVARLSRNSSFYVRTIIIIVSFCVACVAANDDRMEADSAKAAAAIKLRFAQTKTAIERAEKARHDSAARVEKARMDSIYAEASVWVRRLPPDSLDFLPISVRWELNRRKCLIPQPFETESRNAVKGAFTAKGEEEWAVVCSVEGNSQILFITSQSGTVVDSLAKGNDGAWVQGIGDGKSGYSLGINVLPQHSIADLKTDDDGKAVPQPIDHDALDVAFIEKASVAYYRGRDGNWYRVMTSD